MIVCIAEKPSVAKDIARILGATTGRSGYMEGNNYQVTWTFGHLCELKMPEDYSPYWKQWSLASLPMIPPRFGIRLKNDDGIRRQFAVIEKLMQHAEMVINCGDAGQEGELIQRWVMQKAQVKCPVKRLWISSMTDEAIQEGFANLKDEQDYKHLYLAGLSRAIGDWLLGMNATRLYSIKYGQKGRPLSIGRVQTPTLAMIVNRQKEIDSFTPETYWVLSTIYRDVVFTATQGRFSSREEGERSFDLIRNNPFAVTAVEKKNGKEAPPQLYDLTSLQVDCNKRFGMSAEMTLNTVQTLYERKLTTYPRVDTRYLSDDIYPKCPPIMNGLFTVRRHGNSVYAPLIKPLGGKALKKSKKVFDSSRVTDHHAIIPTGVAPQGVSDMEQHVYDLIARRFIAVFYPDCQFATTTIMGKVETRTEGKEEAGQAITDDKQPSFVEFKATGKRITDPGWRVVEAHQYSSAADGNKETGTQEEKEMPVFVKGESGDHCPTLSEKQTTPPKPFTEATLLRAMETAGKLVDDEELRAVMKENGIGRPSTRAAIIETLFKRNYIRKERKNLVPTPTGMELIGIIHTELLKSCELTGIWEKKLRDIEQQKYEAQTFIDELKVQIHEIVGQVLADNSGTRVSVQSEETKLGKKASKGKNNQGATTT